MTNDFKTEANASIEEAYEAAKQGDMYRAYICLDSAIKSRAAALGTTAHANPFIAQFVVMEHWDKLNAIAGKAAENNPEARKILEDSVKKLAEQRERNTKEGDYPASLYT